ncbi:cytochrome P450 2U1-like [Amphiura filiformis]|uniref:cytochrome P450 2U1-like n=1 Tax=Amphiura filiformis TaxID=82378 RepID=UPI003B21F9EA
MDKNTMCTHLVDKYGDGDIVSVNICGQEIVILSKDNVIKEAYTNPSLSDRAIVEVQSWIRYDTAKIHRKIIIGALKGNYGYKTERLEQVIREECQLLSSEIKHLIGKDFDVSLLLRNATANIVLSFTTGKHFEWSNQKLHKLLDTILELNAACMRSFALSFFPIPINILSPSNERQKATCKEYVLSFMSNLIAGHASKKDEITNLIDVYRSDMQLSTDSKHDGDLLRDGLVFITNAGTHTTANAISRIIIHLAELPEIQDRVHQEIIHIVGRDRLPCWSDRHQLHYTQATIMELMRQTRNFVGAPHLAGDETTLRGYTIPRGAILVGFNGCVCDDPSTWPDPEVCKPERFLDEKGHFQERIEFNPFGTGRRTCAGEGMAKMQVLLLMTTLLQRYEIRPPDVKGETVFDIASYAAIIQAVPRKA